MLIHQNGKFVVNILDVIHTLMEPIDKIDDIEQKEIEKRIKSYTLTHIQYILTEFFVCY